MWSIAATSTALAYCLWAFEQVNGSASRGTSLSIVPFVLGLLRYAVDIDAGTAAEPEDIILGDRGLQAIGLVWLVLVCLGVLGAAERRYELHRLGPDRAGGRRTHGRGHGRATSPAPASRTAGPRGAGRARARPVATATRPRTPAGLVLLPLAGEAPAVDGDRVVAAGPAPPCTT